MKKIRDLFDQAEVHLKVLEDHEDDFAELAREIRTGPGPGNMDTRRKEAASNAEQARQETLSVRLGELVRLQSKLEKACKAVAFEVQQLTARG